MCFLSCLAGIAGAGNSDESETWSVKVRGVVN